MSPRPDDHIHGLGGLTDTEIENMLLKSERAARAELVTEMDKLTEKIEERLVAHEERSDLKQQKAADKMDSLKEQVTDLVHIVQGIANQNTAWQATVQADLVDWKENLGERLTAQDAYLHDTNAKVTKAADTISSVKVEVAAVKVEVQEVRHRLKIIAWFIDLFRVFKATASAVVAGAEIGKKGYAAFAAYASGLTLLWVFLHSMLPNFHFYVWLHHKFNWWF